MTISPLPSGIVLRAFQFPRTHRKHSVLLRSCPHNRVPRTRSQGQIRDFAVKSHGSTCITMSRTRSRTLKSCDTDSIHSSRRAFSSAIQLRYPGPQMSPQLVKRHMAKLRDARSTPQPATATMIRNKAQESGMLTWNKGEVGLLPGTAIWPRGATKPSWFSKDMWKLIRLMARSKLVAFISRQVLRFQSGKPRPKIESKRELVKIAKRLYSEMNVALAKGDMAAINSFACGGLQGRMARVIRSRPGEKETVWTLHEYSERPVVVSHRATFLPVTFTRPGAYAEQKEARSSIRQAVVRLKSVQSLTEASHAFPSAAANHKKTVVEEFFVIQKALLRGRAEEWKVWGTMDGHMTLEQIDKLVSNKGRAQPGISDAMAQAQQQMPSM